jgi:hypothetical protein
MKKPTSAHTGATDSGSIGPSKPTVADPPQSIAGVIAAVPGKASPEEKARARRMLDAFGLIRDRSPAPVGRDAEPQSRGISDAASGDVKRKQTNLDDIFAPALIAVGYKKVAKLTYRAGWSTDAVEQFLAFDAYGAPKQYLSGNAGFRNTKAEAFAEQCQQRYVSQTYFRCMPKGGYVYPPFFCLMNFSIGSLLGWEVRDSLDMWGLSPDELASAVVEPIQSKLIPFVGGITTIEGLHDLLESDREPLRWYSRGPYYRAALVAYLARTLDVARETTKASLMAHAKLIENGIDTTRLTAESYIDHILDDANAAVGRSAT